MTPYEHVEQAMLHLEIARLLNKLKPVEKSPYVIKGEEKVANLLDNLDIPYVRQFKFKDCINSKTGYQLRFDFYLPDDDIVIEYDESHHQYDNDTIFRDGIKNQYCDDHGIKMVRIPDKYFSSLNEELLSEFLWNF